MDGNELEINVSIQKDQLQALEGIFLVGNIPELGNWQIDKAICIDKDITKNNDTTKQFKKSIELVGKHKDIYFRLLTAFVVDRDIFVNLIEINEPPRHFNTSEKKIYKFGEDTEGKRISLIRGWLLHGQTEIHISFCPWFTLSHFITCTDNICNLPSSLRKKKDKNEALKIRVKFSATKLVMSNCQYSLNELRPRSSTRSLSDYQSNNFNNYILEYSKIGGDEATGWKNFNENDAIFIDVEDLLIFRARGSTFDDVAFNIHLFDGTHDDDIGHTSIGPIHISKKHSNSSSFNTHILPLMLQQNDLIRTQARLRVHTMIYTGLFYTYGTPDRSMSPLMTLKKLGIDDSCKRNDNGKENETIVEAKTSDTPSTNSMLNRGNRRQIDCLSRTSIRAPILTEHEFRMIDNQLRNVAIFSRTLKKTKPLFHVGHRGMGSSFQVACGERPDVNENTIASFTQAFKHGADFIETDIIMTKDRIPVIYHDFTLKISLPKKKESDKEIIVPYPIHELTWEQLKDIQPYSPIDKHNSMEDKPLPTLREILEKSPSNLGFNLEVKYPMQLIDGRYEIKDFFERNEYVDMILSVLFCYAKSRHIILSCFDPDIANMMKVKQNVYSVFLLSQGPTKKYYPYLDIRAQKVSKSILYAHVIGLDGVILHSEDLLKASGAQQVEHARRLSLKVFVWGSELNSSNGREKIIGFDVDGVIYDRIDLRRAEVAKLSETRIRFNTTN
ncbi:hypothetical protein SNEBB_002307 [Seison nebaliae]|nr:hypothetical protein SNEBB_002307 [Seison nebaliae]